MQRLAYRKFRYQACHQNKSAPGTFNLSAARISKMLTDLRAVKAGTGNCIIVCEGDSNIWGEGGGDSGGNNRVNAKERCWPTIMAKRFAANGIPSTYENLYASGANATVTNPSDFNNVYKVGMSLTGSGWVFSGSTTLGGCLWTNTTDTTSTITIVTQDQCDTIEFQYPQITTAGTISYTIDGGSAVNIVETGTNTQKRTIVSLGSVGFHTIVIKNVTSPGFFGGYRCWNSTIKQCQILNVGRGSSSTTDWVVNANVWSPLPSLQDICSIASGVFLCSTINDGILNMSDATYNANYQTLDVAAAAGGASVLYGTGIPSNLAQVSQAIQDRLLNDLKAKAIANNRAMFAWADRSIDWNTMNAKGEIYNQNHPNTLGYLNWGNFVADQILALV